MRLNKVISILLSLMLLLSLSGVVGAGTVDQDSTTKSATTEVRFVHDKETYVISIPETIVLGNIDVAVEGSAVTASAVVLDAGHCLNVTVSSLNGWKVIYGDPNKNITYDFKFKKNNEGELQTADVSAGTTLEIMHISPGTSDVTTPLTFVRKTVAPSTGTYTDTLTFTVNVNQEAHNNNE